MLRAAPCLFGLYSVVAILYHLMPTEKRTGGIEWPGKTVVTFSDAMMAVRRGIWADGIFPRIDGNAAVQKLPEPMRELLLTALVPAA